MTAFVGDIVQVPSAVSAIKVEGRRAYDRVRSGDAVELAARPVTVSRFEALGVRPEGDLARRRRRGLVLVRHVRPRAGP